MHLKIPEKILADGSATLWNVADDLSLKTRLKAKDVHGATVDLDGGYVVASDAYRADLTFNNFVLNNYVPMD